MKTIALVDLSAIFWRSWNTQKDSDPAGAAHDWTVGRVRRVAEEHEHVAVCCDAKTNWRRGIAPSYKANRQERPPEAWAQLEHVRETLKREGFPVWCCDGFEADDLIASGVAQARSLEELVRVVIVTSDKDLLQLVSDDQDTPVVVQTLGDHQSAPRLVTAGECSIAKEKVPPHRVRDFLALAGDGSDNVPGVRGIGPKKALELLAAYGSFPGVIAALEAEDERLKKSPLFKLLSDQKAAATMSWALVDLRSDAPVDVREALVERKAGPVASPSEARGEVAGDLDGDDEVEGEPVSERRPTAAQQETAPPASALATTTALAPVEQVSWSMQLEPTSGRGAWSLACKLADSRMFPLLNTPEQVLAAILLGRVHGLPAAVACMGCAPIKGKMSMGSAMLIGLVQKHHLCEYLECVSADDSQATWVAKRKGRPERELTFTIEQARRAGYVRNDSLWTKDPETILSWRCGTRLARRVFPDVVAGVYSTEEMTDEERAA